MLHYVGYAYNEAGLPFYLVRGLKKYKRDVSCRVLVFFHEIYATSKSFLKLPFYTSIFQKLIVYQLCRMANTVFTNCALYKEYLERINGNHKLTIIPTGIFSNVPEELFDHKIKKEDHSLVVFGTHRNRKAVYDNPKFDQLLERLKVKSLYDIGPGINHYEHPGVKVYATGSLPHQVLAEYLNKAKFGALSYKPHLLGKSGIFSAYGAYGIIPINVNLFPQLPCDGLVEGKNYFTWRSDLESSAIDEHTTKLEILKWYRTHDQKAVVEKIKMHL
jgi:hypothetical protein